MPTKELVTKVWIEEGCIVCDACETTCPEVFDVTEDTCLIRPEAMEQDFTKALTGTIEDAAEECPVDVIKFDTAPFEVSEEEAAAAAAAEPAADEAPTPAEKAPEAPAPPEDPESDSATDPDDPLRGSPAGGASPAG